MMVVTGRVLKSIDQRIGIKIMNLRITAITAISVFVGLHTVHGQGGGTNAGGGASLFNSGNTGAQGPQGFPGPTGPTGADGQDGAEWFTGSGAPSGSLGDVGDFYINSLNGDYYEKTGVSTWTIRGNLKGPQGAIGVTGATGPTGFTGNTGNKPHETPSARRQPLMCGSSFGLRLHRVFNDNWLK